ncbi:hypothetical protein B0H63DRAFT_527084 [Podospora didyma]|uniref:Uncharacterized protein n=1 Tax=Podospora didyma TaxID=330526 RepID=A0AAE0K9V9_9PEZI|nr:hypothetical protein B0H63DRAFT_527084 [Podospora didyma]
MNTFVANARLAKPNVKFLIGNVVHRLKIDGRDDLPIKTDQCNAMLMSAFSGWNTNQSPVRLVDVKSNDDCYPVACGDGIPSRPAPVPGNFVVSTDPRGIFATWGHVFGARGYDTWELQVRTSMGDNSKLEWTTIKSAVANPQTAPPPSNIITTPTANSVTVFGTPPQGSWNIDRYEIIVFDPDTPGARYVTPSSSA